MEVPRPRPDIKWPSVNLEGRLGVQEIQTYFRVGTTIPSGWFFFPLVLSLLCTCSEPEECCLCVLGQKEKLEVRDTTALVFIYWGLYTCNSAFEFHS